MSQTGFQKVQRLVTVSVGETFTVNIALEVGQAAQSVEVSAEAALLNPDPSNNTPFTQTEVELMPSAGGDITNILWTAPGAVANSTGGYGNFTVNGLPATSNLYTVNGENDMDPYFNINNSGATNLTLGPERVAGSHGHRQPLLAASMASLSGAQVTYVTKSGTNQFHGNAQYWWNGRA